MMGKRKKHQSIKKSNGGGGDVGGLDGSAMVVVTMGDGSMSDPASSLVAAADSSAVMRAVGASDALSVEQKAKRTRARGGNTPRWTEEEEKDLLALREELGERSWGAIAERLSVDPRSMRNDRPHRSASGVEQHWQIMAGKRRRSIPASAGGTGGTGEGMGDGGMVLNSGGAASGATGHDGGVDGVVTGVVGEGWGAPAPAPALLPPTPPQPSSATILAVAEEVSASPEATAPVMPPAMPPAIPDPTPQPAAEAAEAAEPPMGVESDGMLRVDATDCVGVGASSLAPATTAANILPILPVALDLPPRDEPEAATTLPQ